MPRHDTALGEELVGNLAHGVAAQGGADLGADGLQLGVVEADHGEHPVGLQGRGDACDGSCFPAAAWVASRDPLECRMHGATCTHLAHLGGLCHRLGTHFDDTHRVLERLR